MFYNQPIAHRFGNALNDFFEAGQWSSAEIAVAWVRRSGTKHLHSSIQKFLSAGGAAQFTVGVDIENTSKEGLEDLLSWQSAGSIETFIYHNEAETTFHPKVYLLKNSTEARLIVGSNNLTGAGLFSNTEAGLQLDAPLNDPLISEARTALASWRDPSTGFVKKLEPTLLSDLVSLGYVFPESELRKRRQASDKAGDSKKTPKQALFKAQRISTPPPRGIQVQPAQVTGTVLLMRVRRASETARRTQIQIPIKVRDTQFFAGMNALISAHDSRTHGINAATARGSVNTLKVEIPEIMTMNDPVLRLERTPNGIIYQAYDAGSILGAPIIQALTNGFRTRPPVSFATIPDLSRATLWRFI